MFLRLVEQQKNTVTSHKLQLLRLLRGVRNIARRKQTARSRQLSNGRGLRLGLMLSSSVLFLILQILRYMSMTWDGYMKAGGFLGEKI